MKTTLYTSALIALCWLPADTLLGAPAELLGAAGKCLDVFRANTSDRAPVVLYSCHGGANQQWQLPDRGSAGPIVGLGGKCLDVDGANSANGTVVQMFSCHGGDNQRWRHDADGRIVGLDGKCLDIAAGDVANGAGVELFDCTDSSRQRWRQRARSRWNPTNLIGSGSIQEISVAADRPGRAYVAAAEGLFRTDDGGTTWSQLREANPYSPINAVAVTPSDSDRVYFGGSPPAGIGLGRSTDAGQTWQGLPGFNQPVLALAVHPTQPDTIFAGTEDITHSLFRSSDGGDSWVPIQGLLAGYRFVQIEISSADPNVIYAATSSNVYRSLDGGFSWSFLPTPDSPTQLASDPNQPGTIYLSSSHQIFRSDDFGTHWIQLTQPYFGRAGFRLDVAADGRLITRTSRRRVVQTSDNGSTWADLAVGVLPAGVDEVVVDPLDPQKVWLAVGDGNGIEDSLHVGEFERATPAAMLSGRRFMAQIQWRDFAGNSGVGQPNRYSNDTSAFWFFDRDNVEVVVKVLDGRVVNDHFWVFYGALSTVDYTLTVTDLRTGESRDYVNPPGQLASVGDTQAFLYGQADPVLSAPPSLASPLTPPLAPTPTDKAGSFINLNDSRFRVEAEWRDFEGNTGQAMGQFRTNNSGTFWFFNSANIELIVKVLDGRPVNGHFWVFYGALSNVAYTLTVTDTETGQIKVYTNPQGTFGSLADTTAF